ncbi:BgTH12-00350 [Blumeria graminis f. sp. triticale]|uniref:Bgt-1537 n=3 Tax=Blumeria graminis TaxID=34373 RepID=A0A381LGK9_BLUGR|nr:hypothetical protein BGT96224_1537 [Blumeria graminis f. sp. tritici 96224]CAD6504848.1 BgTH12-00350 [Blumeria graminis f. sp. triticale]VDB92872.1 Bgt-1537 [Blumeria graminis f. sp. tritici]
MTSFLTNLVQSIFIPGPTPTLLVATNATFACLQVLLFVLLVSTYSYHFLILSILSASLWSSINWFVNELKAAQSDEAQKKMNDGSFSKLNDEPIKHGSEKPSAISYSNDKEITNKGSITRDFTSCREEKK